MEIADNVEAFVWQRVVESHQKKSQLIYVGIIDLQEPYKTTCLVKQWLYPVLLASKNFINPLFDDVKFEILFSILQFV